MPRGRTGGGAGGGGRRGGLTGDSFHPESGAGLVDSEGRTGVRALPTRLGPGETAVLSPYGFAARKVRRREEP